MKTKEHKTVTTILLFALILACSISFSFASELTVKGADKEAKYGDVIEYTVSMENNSGIAAFLINLEYDTSVFELVKENDGYFVSRGSFSDEGTIAANENSNGCKVVWFNATNSKIDGTLFTIKLKVIDKNASGDYKINLTYSEKNTLDENCNPVSLNCTGGSITVSGDVESTNSFLDVNESHWAYNYIVSLCDKGIINGFEDGTFRPTESVTRAQLVKMLACMSGEEFEDVSSSFDDVTENSWYAPYVVWASKNGIVKGITSTEFNPEGAITREQIATMVYRYCNYKGVELKDSSDNNEFSDQKEISSYAIEAVNDLKDSGVINGYEDGSFKPKKNVSRAEAAKMLYVMNSSMI